MAIEHIKPIEATLSEKMGKTLSVFKSELLTVRAGRANPTVLDKVTVEYYGTKVQIKEMANLSVPEGRVLLITPWDASSIDGIIKAIQMSDVGINPSTDGKVIRMVFPELTEERRKDLVKQIKRMAEDSKVAIRSIRRDANEGLKKLQKDGLITEDEQKKAEDGIQKTTDSFIKDIDKAAADKESEILEF